jgi:hypothetical protein
MSVLIAPHAGHQERPHSRAGAEIVAERVLVASRFCQTCEAKAAGRASVRARPASSMMSTQSAKPFTARRLALAAAVAYWCRLVPRGWCSTRATSGTP